MASSPFQDPLSIVDPVTCTQSAHRHGPFVTSIAVAILAATILRLFGVYMHAVCAPTCPLAMVILPVTILRLITSSRACSLCTCTPPCCDHPCCNRPETIDFVVCSQSAQPHDPSLTRHKTVVPNNESTGGNSTGLKYL